MLQKGNDPEESGDGEEIHQETSERRRIKKPVDFELIELDTGEDAAQYMKETAADDKVGVLLDGVSVSYTCFPQPLNHPNQISTSEYTTLLSSSNTALEDW